MTPFLISPKGEKLNVSFPPGGRLGMGVKNIWITKNYLQ